MTTSVKTAVMACAAASSRGRLTATTPPKALTGSQASARAWASASVAPVPTPQGLACLTIAQAGAANSVTSSKAASASAMLLRPSSLPPTWVAVATPARSGPAR
jgi:hypothetical protein